MTRSQFIPRESSFKKFWQRKKLWHAFPHLMTVVTGIWIIEKLFYREGIPQLEKAQIRFDWTEENISLATICSVILLTLPHLNSEKHKILVTICSGVLLLVSVLLLEEIFGRRQCMTVSSKLIEYVLVYLLFMNCILLYF